MQEAETAASTVGELQSAESGFSSDRKQRRKQGSDLNWSGKMFASFPCLKTDPCHPRNPWFAENLKLPRNLAPDFTHYLSERANKPTKKQRERNNYESKTNRNQIQICLWASRTVI
jgi:hypothetical protein